MTTAIPPTRVASAVGVLTTFKNLAPGGFALAQRIAVIAQGNTAATFSLTKAQMFSAGEAASTYGFGSQIHTIVSQLLPSSGDGVGSIPVTIYPLADGTTAATIVVTPAGTTTAVGTFQVFVNNIPTVSFELASGAVVADATAAIEGAITAAIDTPMTAVDGTTIVTATAKWKGETGEALSIRIEGPSIGMTFGIAGGVPGAGNPSIDSALLDQFGDIWETLVIQSNGDEAASLNAMSAFGEGRWDQELRKPLVSFYCSVETVVATAITIPDARTTDRVNVQLSAPGSLDQPWAIAASMLVRIAKTANGASPASDYVRLEAKGVTPGSDSVQWTSAQRDTAVKGGASTSKVRGGVITLFDTVTMFHPVGDPTPAYRHVRTIIKLQQTTNDLSIEFDSPKWLAAPLVPNEQVTTDAAAKRPEQAIAEVRRLMDSWGLRALIASPATAKDTVVAVINGSNPDRLDITFTIQVTGNGNIISIDQNFGFFFGT